MVVDHMTTPLLILYQFKFLACEVLNWSGLEENHQATDVGSDHVCNNAQ